MIREGFFNADKHYDDLPKAIDPILKAKDGKDLFLQYEKVGMMGRLDPTREFPKVFKGPTIDGHELELLRSVKDIVRLGRISSIEAGGLMRFTKRKNDNDESGGSASETVLNLSSSCNKTVFIDCMAEDFYGYTTMPKDMKIYNKNKINLGPSFFLFNPSLSAAVTAYLDVHIVDDEMKNRALFFR